MQLLTAFVGGLKQFSKTNVYKYTWMRMVKGRVSDRALVDHAQLSKMIQEDRWARMLCRGK